MVLRNMGRSPIDLVIQAITTMLAMLEKGQQVSFLCSLIKNVVWRFSYTHWTKLSFDP